MEYRLLKHYTLNYHVLPTSEVLIPGRKMSMSSYAGTIISLDDFYLASSGLAATETTLFVYDKELYRGLGAANVVYEPIRVITALRLATTGSEWTNIFTKYNSGTYNNQWMILDFNLLNQTTDDVLPDGFFTVLEQLPNHFVIEDQTEALRSKNYWASYNRAYYPEIFNMSGARPLVEKYGNWFTHDKTPRAKILKRDQPKVKNLQSLMSLMRYVDFENDPLASVEGCSPTRTPGAVISNRLDLSSENSSCVFGDIDYMVGHGPYGALDAKVASSQSFPDLEFMAVAGPAHDEIHKPFDWANTNVHPVPSFRPIEKFDFQPFVKSWKSSSRIPNFFDGFEEENSSTTKIISSQFILLSVSMLLLWI